MSERGAFSSVAVTGLGVVSPLGCSVEALVRGFTTATPVVMGDRAADFPVVEMPIEIIPADKRLRIGRLDRLCRMFLSASFLAVDAAGLRADALPGERVGLSFGTGLGCLLTNAEFNQKIVEGGPSAASPRLFAYTVSSAAAGEVSIALGIKGPNLTSHMGLAAGLGAVGYAFDLIQMGKADVVLAGGADVLGPALLGGLRDMGLLKPATAARPYLDSVPGVWPSEGAVVVVLEDADHARRRGAPILAHIAGYAAGFEPTLPRRDPQPTGLAATARRALRLSDVPADAAGMVLVSAHGTPIDIVEQAALVDGLGPASTAMVVAPKAVLGEGFAATGVLSLALAIGLLRRRPSLTPGLAHDLRGRTLTAVDAAARMQAASVVMINSLCYSGDVVTFLVEAPR